MIFIFSSKSFFSVKYYLKLGSLFLILNLGFAANITYAQKRPNILLIMTDDQGIGDVGLHNDLLKTPNMDAIAKQSVELKQFIVNFIGDNQIVFGEVSLANGNGRFEAYLKSGSDETGVQYVKVN